MLYKIKVSHPLINLDGEDEKYFFIEALDEDTAIQQAHQELFLLVPQLFDEYRESVFSIEVLDCSNEGRHCGIENFLL